MSIQKIREALAYDAATGQFTWKITSSQRRAAGSPAGSAQNGYWRICVNGRGYRAHRLAWLMHYGVWPSGSIDHINGDRRDNRISNLRECTHSQNLANTRRFGRTKMKGAFLTKYGTWEAKIEHQGKVRYLGRFQTEGEAHSAYCAAGRELFGEFFNPETLETNGAGGQK